MSAPAGPGDAGGAGGAGRPEPRLFTLEEARRTLPLVRRIVADIVTSYPIVQRDLRELQRRATALSPDEDRTSLEDLREAINREADRINGYVDELQRIGCLFKGFDEGLVDWHAEHEGRRIFLCWKHGEEDIAWWHEVETGFAGRKRITDDMGV